MNRLTPKTLVIISLCLLALGWFLRGNSDAVSHGDQQICEAVVTEQMHGAPELLAKCHEPGMAAMMKAKRQNLSAQETAQAIGSANRSDVGGTLLGHFLLGLGLALLAGGLYKWRKQA
ncbi:MAG: hypothetical protein KA214_09155 [Neisseriaceae bacterium]|nr:hypothetical protein [Neisseriaceae bacterium]